MFPAKKNHLMAKQPSAKTRPADPATKPASGYWLVKSEPFKYSWDQFVRDGKTFWDGVRNYQARNNLRAMKKGDKVLYYHSNEGLEVVGLAEVVREAYQDPTTPDDRWVVVDLKPLKPFERPVTLQEMKADKALENLALVRQGRLSVSDVSAAEFKRILQLGKTKL
jgi:predicted RNA-binding protein with PUA-like domain